MALYEVRADTDGSPIIFDIEGKERTKMREAHPRWLARFIARDHEHAKKVFEALIETSACRVDSY